MSLQIGIVGLPNVGKSTLFNALTKSAGAEAANYPFCTIEPNTGIVTVPDSRIEKLEAIINPERTVPAIIEIVDIAGLVKGASEGEGLGNKFLSHIRQVDAIAHVMRVFEDDDITHVHNDINPKHDLEVIEMELIIADLQTVDKRHAKSESESKSGNKDKKAYLEEITALKSHLESGKLAWDFTDDPEKREVFKDLHLLTMKPIMYVLNLKEDQIGSFDVEGFRKEAGLNANTAIVPICAKVEEDLISFSDEEAQELLEMTGLEEPGLNTLIREAYHLLGLQTYFTAGVKEVRAWTIHQGSTAPQAAGVIHTDFEKGFIKADVVAYDDFVECNGWAGSKEKGKQRLEGKDYVVQNGDLMLFKFNN